MHLYVCVRVATPFCFPGLSRTAKCMCLVIDRIVCFTGSNMLPYTYCPVIGLDVFASVLAFPPTLSCVSCSDNCFLSFLNVDWLG